jgi:hypothetical protein
MFHVLKGDLRIGTAQETREAAEAHRERLVRILGAAPEELEVKEEYSPPTLQKLGTVAELTGTPGTVQQVEPVLNQSPKTTP